MNSPSSNYHRYTQLIEELMTAEPFVAQAEDSMSVQVERGIMLPHVIVDSQSRFDEADRLIDLSRFDRLPRVSVVDVTGHQRPAYRAMLVYSWLQSYRIAFETLNANQFGQWEEALRVWCDLLEASLGEIDWPVGAMPAALGASASEAAWTALALSVAGKVFVRDAWTDLASDVFGKLVLRQTNSGALFAANASDNPETHWYHELVTLHAAASYSVQNEARSVASAVFKATEFHLQETQPDHATNQPYALFAFIWNPNTLTLADQLLHSAQTQRTDIGLMLLADALYCLRLFSER